MKMSQKPLIMLTAGAAALVMSVSAAISLGERNAPDTPPPEAAVLNTCPPCLYTVGEQNGVVAVFSGNSGELLMLTDYPVSALPSADRSALSKGIPISSDEELSMLLEDYQ